MFSSPCNFEVQTFHEKASISREEARAPFSRDLGPKTGQEREAHPCLEGAALDFFPGKIALSVIVGVAVSLCFCDEILVFIRGFKSI
jgi:hypothetical protein